MPDYVDCSSNNGPPDLNAYWAAGHRDLMLKATEGTGYAWGLMPQLAAQWHGLGGRCGYYHWLYGTLSAQSQHDWFWGKVAPVWQAGDWLMTDFEDVDPSRWVSDAQHLNVLRDFNSRCAVHGPVHTYTGNWYLANLPQCTAYLRSQPVVMSDYSNTPPANPYGLNYVAHQYTSTAKVAGWAGGVDLNRWLVDEATLTSSYQRIGGFLMALTDKQQTDLYNRVMQQPVQGLTVALQQAQYNAVVNLGKTANAIAQALGLAVNGDDAHPDSLAAIRSQLAAAIVKLDALHLAPVQVDADALASKVAEALPKPDYKITLEGTAS